MSITYQAYVEAVGPADAITAFKQALRAADPDPHTLEEGAVLPCYAVFNAFTSGRALDLGHQRPQLGAFVHQHHGQFPQLVLRVQLVSECVHVDETVYAAGKCLFQQSSEDDFDQVTDPAVPPPVLVHHREGNPHAFSHACALYGVMAPGPQAPAA